MNQPKLIKQEHGAVNPFLRDGYFDLDGKQYHSLLDLVSAGYDHFWNKPWRIKDKPVGVPKTFLLTMDKKA